MKKLGSLCDGIGGWILSAQRAGIKPVWRAEIDEFCNKVVHKHFPDVINHGDIRHIKGFNIEPVDIICAGTPCQNLSVAGKQEGLKGKESSLFFDAIRIVKETRRETGGIFPRYFIWENVTGAFSSNQGCDFGRVIEEIGETKIPNPHKWANAGLVHLLGCDIGWRVLDAQYWGVPQHRSRIFLVADFAANKRRIPEILFIEKSVSGDTKASKSPQDKATRRAIAISGRVIGRKPENGGNGPGLNKRVSYTLTATDRHAVYDMTHASEVMRRIKGDKSCTLNARMGTGGNQVPVMHHIEKGVIRRFTPLECERLQGLPDGWTDVSSNGKPSPDSKRYKAIGNAMAQPCADFILRQLL